MWTITCSLVMYVYENIVLLYTLSSTCTCIIIYTLWLFVQYILIRLLTLLCSITLNHASNCTSTLHGIICANCCIRSRDLNMVIYSHAGTMCLLTDPFILLYHFDWSHPQWILWCLLLWKLLLSCGASMWRSTTIVCVSMSQNNAPSNISMCGKHPPRNEEF